MRRNQVISALAHVAIGCAAGASAPGLVSDELIVIRDCKEVLLVTPDGLSSPLDALNGNGSTAARSASCAPYNVGISSKIAITSGEAQLVALTLPALSIKRPLLAEPHSCLSALQVAVYDVILKRRVLTVNINPLPTSDYDLALSPDGSQLAILNDHQVSVYPVPVHSTQR